MKKLLLLTLLTLAAYAFKSPTLKGTYKYAGGYFHGKYQASPNQYELRRLYDDEHFDAYVLEPGQQPFKYQSGDYSLKSDSCFETEIFSAQPSTLTGKTIHYNYEFRKDTLILKGVLPNGNPAEEHWIKIEEKQ